MSINALRYRNASIFAGSALVVPPTSVLALASGWDTLVAGTAIGLMTTAAVLAAPLWGILDDRHGSRGLLAAAAGATFGSLLLFGCVLTGFKPAATITVLCIFGAASGGIDPLVSAHIQRAGLMWALPRIRFFGALGWTLGLVVALILTAIGWGATVYLAAAMIFGSLTLAEIRAPAANQETRRTRSRRPPIPRGLVVLVLVGLPVPISAYSYLIYSSSALDAFGTAGQNVPFLTLIVLASLELPVFALLGARLKGWNLAVVYCAALLLLAISWVPSALDLGSTTQALGLLLYTTAVAIWTIAQISAVRAFARNTSASFVHTVISAGTKALSAIAAGSGMGWLASSLGDRSAPVFLLALSLIGLLLLGIAVIAFPSIRLAKIPTATDERKHHVYSN